MTTLQYYFLQCVKDGLQQYENLQEHVKNYCDNKEVSASDLEMLATEFLCDVELDDNVTPDEDQYYWDHVNFLESLEDFQ